MLSRTATSLLKNAGVSEAVARDIIGHESAALSRHYAHIGEDSKRKALARLPDLFAPGKNRRNGMSTITAVSPSLRRETFVWRGAATASASGRDAVAFRTAYDVGIHP